MCKFKKDTAHENQSTNIQESVQNMTGADPKRWLQLFAHWRYRFAESWHYIVKGGIFLVQNCNRPCIKGSMFDCHHANSSKIAQFLHLHTVFFLAKCLFSRRVEEEVLYCTVPSVVERKSRPGLYRSHIIIVAK